MRLSLTGRFSALFLSALALALLVFSAALYIGARVYLERRVRERLDAALAILAAAAEIHGDSVEWEPRERDLSLGTETGPDHLRWLVLDDRGRRIDQSDNFDETRLALEVGRPRGATDAGSPRTTVPVRLRDGQGGTWQVARRLLRPDVRPNAAAGSATPGPRASLRRRPASFFDSLELVALAPLGPTEATLATLAGLEVVLSLCTWLAAAALCHRLSRRALRPLSRMVESARGLDAADVGWSVPEAGTGDELDELGRALNDLLSRLHVAYERQRRFSGDASHQLRTPLTILIGQLEVALRQERSGDEYRRALASALRRAEQLAGIIEALLFLSRAEAEAALPGAQAIEWRGWVSDHLAARPSGNEETPIVHRRDADDPLWIRAHPALLGQLLDNLLDNAAKYGQSGTGKPIVVETRRDGDTALLAVADSGPGIAPEDLPHIFEPFYRATRDRRRGVAGVGLGLAIVRRIATACGGSVTVQSDLGAGSRFEVRFPIALPPANDARLGAEPYGSCSALTTAGSSETE